MLWGLHMEKLIQWKVNTAHSCFWKNLCALAENGHAQFFFNANTKMFSSRQRQHCYSVSGGFCSDICSVNTVKELKSSGHMIKSSVTTWASSYNVLKAEIRSMGFWPQKTAAIPVSLLFCLSVLWRASYFFISLSNSYIPFCTLKPGLSPFLLSALTLLVWLVFLCCVFLYL